MTPNKKNKDFDAVKMMRDIRDKIDRDIAKMTFAEEREYLKRRAVDRPKRPETKVA